MALETTQLQKKPRRSGFFVLLAIIAVVIFAAYALTKKHFQNNSVTPELSQSEKEAIASQFKDFTPPQLSQKEKQIIADQYSEKNTAKPLTDEERKNIASQFSN